MDEGMTAIADELATPAIETQEQKEVPDNDPGPVDLDAEVNSETEVETGEAEVPEAGDEPVDAPPAEPDVVEIEINGKKYAVPAELKDGYLMQADYTRKTQEVASERKAAEAQREQAAALFQSSQEYIEAKAFALNLDNQLKQYENLDWNKLEQEDPMGAMSHWRQFQTMKEQRGQVAQYLQNAETQRTAQAEQDIANRLQETRKYAQEKIPGYSVELENKVADFAVKELGFQIEQLQAAISPQVFRTLHLAWLGSQALQKQQSAPRPAVPTQPLRTVSSKASPTVTKDPSEMSMAEYDKWASKRFKD